MKTIDNIKERVQLCYKLIKDAQEELEHIRKDKCTYPSFTFVNYSDRIGTISKQEICDICGELKNNITKWY